MFGLMRFRGQAGTLDEQRQQWRLHYCGTCKTLGRRYGQRARVLLNHDAVFLAELLNALGAEDEQWAAAYVSWNCMSLPAAEETPVVLRYVSAANVLLSEYKVADHEADSPGWRWQWVRLFLSPSFRKAHADLAAADFPVDECARILNRQVELERRRADIDQAAGPTAEATALVFEHGARIAGLDAARGKTLAAIGYRFGYLVYLLDAWEDFERDARTGAFNALQSSGVGREWAALRIREEAAELETALMDVRAPRELRLRLRSNVESRLGMLFPSLDSCSSSVPRNLRERWHNAFAKAREFKAPPWTFTAVAGIAFLFPAQARTTRSSGECLSLGINLMALGGLLAAIHAGGPKTGCLRSCYNSSCGQCFGDCTWDCCCEGCCDSCCDSCGDSCCSSCDCS